MLELMNEEDRELDDIFHGEAKPLHPDTIYITSEKPASNEKPISKMETPTPKKEQKPIEEQWNPEKPEPNFVDKLKVCAKSAMLFGGLSCLLFYWEQAGLMAESIAVPCMCLCTALAGWGVGKGVAGGK